MARSNCAFIRATLALRQSQPAEAERWALASLARRPDHFATLMLAAAAARAQGDGAGAEAVRRVPRLRLCFWWTPIKWFRQREQAV